LSFLSSLLEGVCVAELDVIGPVVAKPTRDVSVDVVSASKAEVISGSSSPLTGKGISWVVVMVVATEVVAIAWVGCITCVSGIDWVDCVEVG
jgi:hypothetical protein